MLCFCWWNIWNNDELAVVTYCLYFPCDYSSRNWSQLRKKQSSYEQIWSIVIYKIGSMNVVFKKHKWFKTLYIVFKKMKTSTFIKMLLLRIGWRILLFPRSILKFSTEKKFFVKLETKKNIFLKLETKNLSWLAKIYLLIQKFSLHDLSIIATMKF